MAFVVMILLQWAFPTPDPIAQQGEDPTALAQTLDGDANDLAEQPDSDSETTGDADDDSASAASIQRKPIDPEISFLSDEEILERVAGENAESAEINAWLQQRSLTSVRQMGDLVTIGSLHATGADRYLITINPYGGTVRRIELNARDERTGKFKYRDLVWRCLLYTSPSPRD